MNEKEFEKRYMQHVGAKEKKEFLAKYFKKGFKKTASATGDEFARQMILSKKYDVDDVMKKLPANKRSGVLKLLRDKKNK